MQAIASEGHRHDDRLLTRIASLRRVEAVESTDEIDILLPNEAEMLLSGPGAEVAMDALCAQGAALAVKRGVRGNAGRRGAAVEVFAFRVVAVIPARAILSMPVFAAWLRGATLAGAGWGSHAAALGTTAYGGFDGQPDWNALLRLVEEGVRSVRSGATASRRVKTRRLLLVTPRVSGQTAATASIRPFPLPR